MLKQIPRRNHITPVLKIHDIIIFFNFAFDTQGS